MIKKAITFFCTGLLVLTGFAQAPDVSATTAWNNGSNNSAGFYENKGQVHNLADDSPNADVKFMLERGATQVFLMKTGIAYQFSRMQYPEGFRELSGNADPEKRKQAEMLKNDIRIETWRMDMVLVDANEKARVTTEERSSDFINYYNRDALDVHHYGKVTYHDIYPGIDWVIYLSGENMKYDFIVHPGGDPSQIVIRCSDYETLQLNEDGSCSLGNKMGMITENSPVSFQNGNPVATQFKLVENTIRFSIGDYNKNETLVIDPVVREWGTYYGGPYYDAGFSCAADLSGNVFLAGKTASLVGIAAGGHQNSHAGGYDALLVKFTSAGARLWATYYGGGADDSGDHCVTDASGNVYLSGYTESAGSIASGGHQNIFAGGYDLYLAKFNSSGTRVWATYYGGGADEFQSYCTTDASGNVYLSGEAASSGSIASGGHQNSYGGGSHDAFLVKFNAAGVRQWGTYYGGTGDECAYTCTTDATGNVYLAGSSSSSTAIASGGHQNTSGGLSDAFLVKFNSGGARQWATYYGGAGDDLGMCCQVNGAGDIYLGGITTSSTSISSGGHQNTFGGNHDGFLVKFNAAGVRQWGTYYGDAGEDFIYADALDADGNIYIAGATGSTSAIASGGYQNTNAGYTDGFFVKFNPSGIREWGTYYGGTSLDYIYDFTINAASVIHFCGYTGSTSGIAGNGFLNTTLGSDVFLVKFTLPPGATLNFDGSNDVVNVPASPAFDFASGTVECWFNPAASSGNRCLVAMRTNTSGARWSIHVNENTNEIGVFNGAAFASIPVNINPGTWYHLAAVLTNSGTIMYLNGVNIGTIPLVLQTGSTGLPLSIGGHSDIAWPEYFEGSIDEVRIWNRPLCASEITSCMSGETPAFTNGLIADYHFNQGYDSGINTGVTTLTDATGNHHGTLQNFTLNGTTSNWIAPGGVTSGSTATPVITASISSSASVSCNGGSNGSATVAASGTGPFTYSWAPAGGTSATATGLTAGTYTCTISNGCVSILASVTITQPAAISLSTVVTPISCTSSNNGAIDLTVTGGVGPYTYAWSFGYTTQDISNLYTGTYQVTVTDANGCQATSSVISVSSASTVSTSYTAGTIACHGGTTTVTVTPTGGTMPYTYAWSPSGGNAAVSTPIGPGMYYFTVTDANGCSSSQSLVISEPAALSVSASQGTIACNGGTTTAG
ncbi:MAG TPA: LamG-like jellyroll fold domain-containing protein, partial [Bacteroidia bacterium]|nr:LamG-like jellyroll fold domain-containing protein [Bacteroidia bacterium]